MTETARRLGNVTPSHASWARPLRMALLLGALGGALSACGGGEEELYGFPHDHEPIATVRQLYDGALTPELAVSTYRNTHRLFATRRIEPARKPVPLPPSPKPLKDVTFAWQGQTYHLGDYLTQNRVAGLLILKDGKVAHETYRFGNTRRTRWMSMSMAKSVTSTLIGAAVRDGYISSLDDPVTKYVPRLAGSGYETATVRDVISMTSGVQWSELYTDPTSDRRRLLEAQIAQTPGAMLEVLRSVPRVAPHGSVFNYSTGETQVAGEVLIGAVQRPAATYLSEKIWRKFGMEHRARWWLDAPHGHEIGGSGISATLRDYARFGLFIMNDGVAGGEPVLPSGWVTEAGSPLRLSTGETLDFYGYAWWIDTQTAPGAQFFAGGIFGQYIYIDRPEKVVIAVNSAWLQPTGQDQLDFAFFKAVVDALRQ
ncbi:beta-lactamase family protein [Aquabacterium sp. A7-Y]|uniref:serine hydrolase domain-containing protein n=1 Tax=Aquabacterium sp. A7-Y TaxID=1349605 RepID=UPI00223E2632|nr:serine hydrolase [Aquabacterium sp. A7-Y]MCW7541348.1 beta-lactamase family protein [Aquabacterium sp. A7-Y]